MKIIDKIVDSLDGLFSRLEARTQARREKGPSREERLVIYRAAALRSLVSTLPIRYATVETENGTAVGSPEPPTVDSVGVIIAVANAIAQRMVALEGVPPGYVQGQSINSVRAEPIRELQIRMDKLEHRQSVAKNEVVRELAQIDDRLLELEGTKT